MPLIAAWLGFAFACGVNSYAAIVTLGIVGYATAASVPGHSSLAATPFVFALALALYAGGFIADKRRDIGALWDAAHAFVRPTMAAALTFLVLASLPLGARIFASMAGGCLAFAVHGTKASVRFAANAMQDRLLVVLMSLMEDGFAVALVVLSIFAPILALVGVGVGTAAVLLILPRVFFAFIRAVGRTLDSVLTRTH